jgi:hypothetical protein
MRLTLLLYGFLILQTVERKKANWISLIVHRNCLLKHVIEGKIEGRIDVMERRVRRLKQLLVDLTERGRGSARSYFMENSLWKSV